MHIDLNSDLGESFGRWELGDDEALLSVVTSANVACGFHAGDPLVLRRVCEQAARRGVVIGAQVGYRDLVGFGRRPHDRVAGERVRYVKPHGALYNAIVHHEDQARAVVEAVRLYDPDLAVLGLPGSLWLTLAEKAGLRVVREAFADRAYTPEGTLVPRRHPGAVLHSPEEIAERCLRIANGDPIPAIDGTPIRITADSLCVHGDTPDAVRVAEQVAQRLSNAGINLKAFAHHR